MAGFWPPLPLYLYLFPRSAPCRNRCSASVTTCPACWDLKTLASLDSRVLPTPTPFNCPAVLYTSCELERGGGMLGGGSVGVLGGISGHIGDMISGWSRLTSKHTVRCDTQPPVLNSQLMASHKASPNTRCPHLYRNQLCTRYSSLWSGGPCEPYPVRVGCLEGSSSVEIKCVMCLQSFAVVLVSA